MSSINTLNKFAVHTNSKGEVNILLPPQNYITREEALVLAAWIVVLAGADLVEFDDYVEAVEES